MMRTTAIRRALAYFARSRHDDDLREEVEAHIDERRRSLIAEGLDPRDAAFEARRMFGNVTAIREETRDMRSFRPIDTLVQDVRYGLRLLRRSPVFTASAVGSLALGIGSAAAVFSLADTLLLRKLPVRAPEELVLVRWTSGPESVFESLTGTGKQTETEMSSTSFSRLAYDRTRTELAPQADVIGFADLYRSNLAIDGKPEIAFAHAVSGNYFNALGLRPAAGRLLVDSDDARGAQPAAVLGYDMWQRRFGGSHAVVGRPLVLNGVSFLVAGVMPKGFNGTLQVAQPLDVAVPLAWYGEASRGGSNPEDPNFWWVLMMGRLRNGATAERVQSAADLIVKQTVAAHKPNLKPEALPRVRIEPGSQGQTETRTHLREPIRIMAAVVLVVLLVACANVANLLLARGRARARELAVRSAIGAPRRRIVRQLLTEGLLLGAIASAIGLVLAQWMAAALIPALASTSDSLAVRITLDVRIVAFTCLLAVVCSIVFALVPAVRSSEAHITTGLQEHSRGSVGSRRRFSAAGTLVIVQVALSMLLVTAAGLLAWSARNLQGVDPGFDPRNLLTFSVDTSLNGYDVSKSRTLTDAALERLRALPGVTGASMSSHRLIADSSSIGVARQASETPPPLGSAEARQFGTKHRAWRLVVDGGFFETMKIPLLRGRTFTFADVDKAPLVVIVNTALANQLFGSADVVGRRISMGIVAKTPELEIVGVVADAKYTTLKRDAPPTAYFPYQQGALNRATFEMRTSGDPMAYVSAVREALRSVDDTLPIFDIRTQEQQIVISLERELMLAKLATLLGGVTLLLSGIGLYGLLAYAVTRRTPEIGVRMALGAEKGQVRWMILRQSFLLVAIGLALGIPGAAYSSRFVESLLFGLTAADPKVLIVASVVMVVVGCVAAYVPARRASRIDPLTALRAE